MPESFDPSGPASHAGIYGLPFAPEESQVVLLPVPWEATTSYGAGTANGPSAILAASRQVDLLDRDTGRPYQAGIAMLPISRDVQAWNDEARLHARPLIEAGGPGRDPSLLKSSQRVDQLGDRLNTWVRDQAGRWLDSGKIVGIVGGDHSVPLGAIEATAARRPGLGILHVDAHADLRAAYEGMRYSHASIMWNALAVPGVARIVQVGVRDYCDEEEERIKNDPERVMTFFDPDLRRQILDGEAWSRLCGGITATLPREVYVSFDIDGLDPSLCPHTGTPVPGGLSFAEAVALLRTVVESGRQIVGFDLTEVAPDPSGRTEWDGTVGARVLYKLIGFTLLAHRE